MNRNCFFGLHHYELKDELGVSMDGSTNSKTVGVNYVSICKNCGKIISTFVPTNSNYLECDRGVRTNK